MDTMPLTSEYNKFAEEREREIRELHDYVFVNMEYSIGKDGEEKVIGETDFMGYDEDNGVLTIYEFKSSRKSLRRKKGVTQLRKAKKYYSKHGLTINRQVKKINKIVTVLEMYGPDDYDKHGRERIELEEF